jgi:hypothetical protein
VQVNAHAQRTGGGGSRKKQLVFTVSVNAVHANSETRNAKDAALTLYLTKHNIKSLLPPPVHLSDSAEKVQRGKTSEAQEVICQRKGRQVEEESCLVTQENLCTCG